MFGKPILWIIGLVIAVGFIILISISSDEESNNISQQTPTPFESVSSLPSPSPSPRPTILTESIAATCQIGGEIIFLNKSLYENKNAKIAYQNVDDVIRQIYWKSNPEDGVLVVGPNLFEGLPLPSGERNVGVALAKETAVKNYTLTASITYGIKNINGIVEERIANCLGKVIIQMP